MVGRGKGGGGRGRGGVRGGGGGGRENMWLFQDEVLPNRTLSEKATGAKP